MKQMKRLLSLALALVLVLSMLPANVLAAEAAPALPTAKVSQISKEDLTFAMNFRVNSVTAEQLAYYGDWYADFELTINKNVTFNSDGSADGWLSGQYDEWSYDWVNVPFGNKAPVTVKANETVKIMAFAAELMNKAGLKYTFKEVVEVVKDFKCGIYFDDEFLANNPDLVVTLELKMYNPANEAENYVIGETYTYENPIVAKNTTTGKVYASISEAMLDCAAGQTVIPLKDIVEPVVYVLEDTTLNLNGKTVTANYVSCFGDIIDSSAANSGLLAVPANRFLIRNDNAQLPVRNGNGYRFVEVLGFNTTMDGPTKFVFQPLFETGALEWLKAGTAASGVTIQVQISWMQNDGLRTQKFVYNDNLLVEFIDSHKGGQSYRKVFTLTLNGVDNIEGLTFTAVAVSDIEVSFTPDSIPEQKPTVTAPTGLTANYGQTLADVALPEGFIWLDPSASVGAVGNNSFAALHITSNIEVMVTIAVSKVTPSYEIPTGLTANYGQTLADVALPAGFAWVDATASVGNAGVNTFAAVFTPEDTNFDAVEVEISITVAKIDPSYDIPTGLTANYGQTLADVVLPAGFAWVDATASVGNAGVNTFAAVFTHEDTNYNTVAVEISVTVSKVDPGCEVPTGLTANYGQTLADVALPAGFAWVDATASVGNAGVNTFIAVFTPDDLTNYNTVEVAVSVTVAKIDPSYDIPTGLTANYGQTLADVALPAGFAWVDATTSVGNAGVNTFAAVFTHEDTNYNTVAVEISVTVSKVDPRYEIPVGLSAKYGQTLANVNLPSGFTWKDSSTVLDTVGTFSFAATFTPDDKVNYNTVDVNIPVVITRDPVKKFASKFTGDFLYRIGNKTTVTLGQLFAATENITGTVDVTIETITGAAGTYAAGSTWSNGVLTFSGTGVVKVTVTDNDFCIPTVLYLEVVNATNVTGATSATTGDIVLLNDCSASSLTVSNGYTFYGNGFTINFTGDGSYRSAAVSYGFVTLDGGTLDNVQIKCRIFPESYLFSSEMKADSTGRYPYGYSAVIVTASSVISNCYIYGARNNIHVAAGNVLIADTVLECGSLANIHCTGSGSDTVTLHNVTTIQYPVTDDFGKGNTILGFGVLVGTNESSSNPVIKLTGDFKQYNWVDSSNTNVSNAYAKMAIKEALANTTYQYTINGATTVNMGIAILNRVAFNVVDERVNKDAIPYALNNITINGLGGQVCAIKAGSSAISAASRYDATVDGVIPYAPSKNNVIVPPVSYNDSNSALSMEKVFANGTWQYTLLVDLDKMTGGAYTFDFSKLAVTKYGTALSFAIKDASGNTVANTATITLNQLFTGEYTLSIVDNQIYNAQGELTGESATHVIPFALKATKTSIDPPKFSNAGTATAIRLVSSKGGDWRPAYTVLTGVTVTYWSASEGTVKTIDLATLYNSGTISGSTWTYTCSDFTLTITGGQVHSDGTTIKPVVSNNTLYFASTDKAFGTGTTSRDIILTYVFTDKNASTTWSRNEKVTYSSLSEYDFNSFKNGTLKAPSSCVTGDTLVTLADGSTKRIDEITSSDLLLVWNFFEGKYDVVPAAIIFDHGADYNTVIKLIFSDGTTVNVVNTHQFFNVELNQLVTIKADTVADFVGTHFVKYDGNSNISVELVAYEITEEYVEAWGVISALHYNILVEGMLSADFELPDVGLFNYFAIGDDLKFDEAQMQVDIEKYGLYTYEDFADYLTYEQFVAFNVQYFKIAVGKGNYTYEGILRLIERYL